MSPLRAALPLCLLLGACAELPPVEGTISEAGRAAPQPELVPVGPILAEGAAPSRAAAAGLSLDARAGSLRREAAAVDAPGADLRRRAAALEARAAALRDAPL